MIHRLWQQLLLPLQQSLSAKILFLTGLVGGLLLLAMGWVLIGHQQRSLLHQEQRAVEQLAQTAGKGLQAIMLAGQATVAQGYMDRMKEVEGLESFQIYRTTGLEAFREEGKAGKVAAALQEPFQQVLRERKPQMVETSQPNGRRSVVYFAPLLNQSVCHQCHGKDHEVRGVFQLSISRQALDQEIEEARNRALLVMAVAIPLLLLLKFWVIRHSIRRPLKQLREAIDRVGHGDLTHLIPLPAGPLDEMGRIIHKINSMTKRFGVTIRQVFLQTNSMAACVGDLLAVKEGLAADSMRNLTLATETARDHQQVAEQVAAIQKAVGHTTQQVGSISAATEQFSANIATIAQAADMASSNINTMASAAEEITANIGEVNNSLSQVDRSVSTVATAIGEVTASMQQVRQRCQGASRESKLANDKAIATHEVMARLGRSAQEIGQVLEVIDSIADQTNMLALNASIEAAGAGEAGKGFAVVANEIKALARQTVEATKTISEQIQQIQDNSRDATLANQEIAAIIGRIDHANTGITHAVDEQAVSIREISRSMNEVTQAAGDVTRTSQELNLAARDVASSALDAANGTREVARSATEAATAAETLARQSSEIFHLSEQVARAAGQAAQATTSANLKVQEILQTSTLVNGSIHHTSLLINSVAIPGRKLAESVHDLHITPEPFPVATIKGAHLKWLGKLEYVIRGRSSLSPEQVTSGRDCDFGKWYYTEGTSRFDHLAIFRQVGEVHLRVHDVARETVKLVGTGDIQAAEKKMDQFSEIKDRLFDLLDQLYLAAGEEKGPGA